MGCAHVCGEDQAWVHPAMGSGLILLEVSFHMQVLIWSQALLNKNIQLIVSQSPRINPLTIPPGHKHHACHLSMPNNLERRVEVRGSESTEAAHGSLLATQRGVEGP